MIEVLVSIVILSIGLLGYAGLMLKSNKDNLTSYYRSQATLMAYDIIDCMRVNPVVAKSGGYNTTFTTAAPSGTNVNAADLVRWKSNLSTTLPVGQGNIQVSGNTVTIQIRWTAARASSADAEFTTFTTQSQL